VSGPDAGLPSGPGGPPPPRGGRGGPEGLEPVDLELQRHLDAAFSQTRPRRGFEDTLWARLEQRSRRSPRTWPAGLLNRVPRSAWPALGGLAAVLVLLIAVLPLVIRGHQGGSSASSATSTSASAPATGLGPVPAPRVPGSGSDAAAPATVFGLLPTPRLAATDQSTSLASGVSPYYGPATLSVIAGLATLSATLPVFRFVGPSAQQAAAIAKSHHGQPVTTSSPPFREPRVQITASKTASAGGAPLADAQALAAADEFLAGRNLALPWSYLPHVVDQGPLAIVRYVRQFAVNGQGLATQVDQLGEPAGADFTIRPDGVVLRATVPMQLQLQASAYPARASQQVARDAVNVPPPSSVGLSTLPQVQLSQASLVYIAVAAGGFGYFEPAYLFSGTFTAGSARYEKRVLVPALDASQLR
jgi:hypothetical protein